MVPSSEARNNISARIDFWIFRVSINYACFRRAFGFAARGFFALGFAAGFLAAADGLADACLATDGFRAAGLAAFFAGFGPGQERQHMGIGLTDNGVVHPVNTGQTLNGQIVLDGAVHPLP